MVLLAATAAGCGGAGAGPSTQTVDAAADGTAGKPEVGPAGTDETGTTVTPQPDSMNPSAARMIKLAPSSCEDVTGVLRAKALAAMNAALDAELARAKRGHREICRPIYDASAGGLPPGAPTQSGGATTYSSTNNQVAGVDEADFVKNDGKYIYVATGRELRIVEAWPAASARTIARVAITGSAQKLFVHKDRAVVYTREGSGEGRKECTYGYECIPSGDGQPWTVAVYDITDRSKPVLLRQLRSSSSWLAARRVGDAVHTVLVKESGQPIFEQRPPEVASCGGNLSDAEIEAAFARLRAKNHMAITTQPLATQLPSVTDTRHPRDGGAPVTTSNLLTDCENFFREDGLDGRAFTTVLSFDLTKEEDPSTATIFSSPGVVYASADALYLAVPHVRAAAETSWYPDWEQQSELTTVHKFRLAGASATFVASGAIKGRVLNQFALDEHEGHLRVATTTGRLPSPGVHSTLSVLHESDDGQRLGEVGRIDQLAPSEDIRSVRFDGKRGYIVTFKKTDPLFVLDLADPAKPRVEAELKIPGFSTYMHRMDDKHLLTIGYDAADQGNFAFFTGVLLQIFDVSDPKAPKLAHKHVIGTRGSSSEALTNHLAFNYFPPKNALLLPMTICENEGGVDGGNIFGARPTFSGLLAFDTTAAAGFRERGRVPFTAGAQVHCGNWWTDASSVVRRSIVMDDFVFSISGTTIKASSLAALAQPVATVSLTD